MSDRQLLREYAKDKSDVAFRRLVDKYMNLVYWTCRRNVRDAQTAEDATQGVFLLLAQKAGSIRDGIPISGWLFNTARLVAKNAARHEAHVRITEQLAVSLLGDSGSDVAISPDIEALLDDAIADLPSADREVILLRFYDRLSYRDIAREVGATENTVTQRALRALEKMRRYFEQRKVTVNSTVLGSLMAQEMARPVPETCRAAVSQSLHNSSFGQAGASSPALSTFNPLLAKGLLVVSTSKIIAGGVAAVVLILGLTFTIIRHTQSARPVFTASVALPVAPADSDSAAALAETKLDINDYNARQFKNFDPKRPPYVAQTFTVTQDGKATSYSSDAAYASYIRANWTHVQNLVQPATTVTVNSFQLNGDTAIIGWQLGMSGELRSDSSPANSPPPGFARRQHFLSVSQECYSTFSRTSGHWIMESEADNVPTVIITMTQGREYAKIALGKNGHPKLISRSPGFNFHQKDHGVF